MRLGNICVRLLGKDGGDRVAGADRILREPVMKIIINFFFAKNRVMMLWYSK